VTAKGEKQATMHGLGWQQLAARQQRRRGVRQANIFKFSRFGDFVGEGARAGVADDATL